ncbi:MAG: hypothetical protein H7834_16200 [Magnetococcus sp. YQC-9]
MRKIFDYSIDQALTDLGITQTACWSNGVLALQVHERLFVGGKCEPLYVPPDPCQDKSLPHWVTNFPHDQDGIAICLGADPIGNLSAFPG